MKTVAVFSIKGGVGKTTASVNLSYLSSEGGRKTLVCDFDPQGSATYYFRVKPRFKSGATGLVRGGEKIAKNIKGTNYGNLDLIPADVSYRNLDLVLDQRKKSRERLRKVLMPFASEYEYTFLDCPPGMSMVAENIFNAADCLLLPVVPTVLAVHSHEILLKFLKKTACKPLVLAFFSMVEKRKRLHREVMERLSAGNAMFLESHIPFRAEIERTGLDREPVPVCFPQSGGARYYRSLWAELQGRLRVGF